MTFVPTYGTISTEYINQGGLFVERYNVNIEIKNKSDLSVKNIIFKGNIIWFCHKAPTISRVVGVFILWNDSASYIAFHPSKWYDVSIHDI